MGPPPNLTITLTAGDAQTDTVGRTLAPYIVTVTDTSGAPIANVTVTWSTTLGGGAIAPPASTTNAQGVATATRTLGTLAGTHRAQAAVSGATGSPVTFSAIAVADAPSRLQKVAGDGQTGDVGQTLLTDYTVRVTDQYGNAVHLATVQWTPGPSQGSVPTPTSTSDPAGLASARHTLGATPGPDTVRASLAAAGAAVEFVSRALLAPTLVATVAVPANYGLHDTYVRDGLAFLCAWNTGVQIYDVGNGVAAGTPASPQLVGTALTTTSGLAGRFAHNAWWFHNPATSQQKYLFVGQEGSGQIGASASGDIHVVDVSNLAAPVEVATYHLNGAGAHNFWMDEAAQVLYAAYYNGGVVALDVSGTLSGDLASRELARLAPGGAGNTYTWGVMQSGGSLYAVDMLSGLWQLNFTGSALTAVGGGNNVPDRYGSDLWVYGNHAYTGTWGGISRSGNPGNALKIWRLSAGGAPSLVDSLVLAGIATVSDVQVSDDGRLLVLSAEGGPGGANSGVYVYGLANPEKPGLLGRYLVSTGVHTVTVATVNGRRYAFAAKNPASPALLILDITDHAP